MTIEQAIEIREHLITELNANGFGQVVTEINIKMEENHEEFERKPHGLLLYFFQESITVLENLSNRDYEQLLEKFNRYTEGENRIDSIVVELID